MRAVDVKGQGLESLDAYEEALKDAVIVDASDNALRTIATGLCECKSLESVNLGSNRLDELLAEIERLTSLRELSIYDNRLSSLPPLSGLSALKRLVAFGNQITRIPRLPPGVVRLDLSHNEISPDISGLTNLKVLSLNSNAIRSVPQSLYALPQLERVLPADNPIADSDRRALEAWSMDHQVVVYL